MNHSRGTSRGARLTMRLAIVLCLAVAFVAIPAVALAAPVTTSNAVATYNNTAVISINATTGVGNPAYVGTRYWFDASAPATVSAWPTAASVSISTLGAHTLSYFSVDASGVIEATQVKSFTIADTIKPTTISDVSATYLDTAAIHLTAADSVGGSGVAHTYYKIDGGATTEGTLITVSTYGAHTIQFWSVDVAGNTESVVPASFYVDDSTAPVTTSDRVATYYDSTAHITLTATDTAGSGVDATYYNLDGTGWDVGTSVDANTLGSHTLSFYSVDMEANKEDTKTVTFTVLAGPAPIDGVAPVSTSNAAATYPTSPVSIRLSSIDNVGGTGMAALYYRVDGGAIVTITPSAIHAAAGTPRLGIPADHSPAAPTSCACHATLIPATHSAGASPATCACHAIDKPTVPVEMPHSHEGRASGCKTCHPAAGVILPVSSSNPNHYGQTTGYIGGGECEACHTFHAAAEIPPPSDGSINTTVVVTGVGAHTIEFWGADVAGNIETPHKTASFTILPVEPTDGVAPVSSDNAAATYEDSPVSIRLTSTDNVGGSGMAAIYYRIDGGTTVEVNPPSGIRAAVGTPELGIPADHSPAAPTSCACHATLIPATHSAGASPATCLCHVIEAPSVPVDVPSTHAARITGDCNVCHPALGVIMPTSSSNPNHYGQTAGYMGGGECRACHTFNVLSPPPPPASMSTTVVVSGLGAHTIEYWGKDVAGNVETPHKTASFTIVPSELDTSITIHASGTTAYVGNFRTLSGVVTPVGMIGHNIVAMVKKPGRTFYSYSSNRTVYDLGGTAAWLYKYKFIAGMTKGIYVFRADVPVSPGFLASSSGTVTIRLR